jgi:hypothetical protein
MKIIEVEKIRDILVMKLFSNNNSKNGLCLTFFFIPLSSWHNSTFYQILGVNWEKIGRKLGGKNINKNSVIYPYTK